MIAFGILIVLAAFSAAYLGRSREMANQASCANNLRQLYLALASHEMDHGSLPFGPTKVVGPYTLWDLPPFYTGNEEETWTHPSSYLTYLAPYLDNHAVGLCPTAAGNPGEVWNSIDRKGKKSSYIWYIGASGYSWQDGTQAMRRRLANPLHPEAITDGYASADQDANPASVWLLGESVYAEGPDGFANPPVGPHGKSGSYRLYADGHVAKAPPVSRAWMQTE